MATNEPSNRPILGGDRVTISEADDALALQAATGFLGDRPATLRRVTSGLSGGQVYQCSTARGVLALKRWPLDTPAQRLDEVHAVQRFARTSLDRVPELVPFQGTQCRASVGGFHFDLSTWMPGSPFSLPLRQPIADPRWTTAALDAVEKGARAIAQFHRATHSLGCSSGIAPAVLRRLQRLSELKTELPATLPRAQSIGGAVGIAASGLRKHGPAMFQQSEAALRPWISRTVEIQWVLRDVHREHLLFENGAVSGIVDFDAVRQDTRATDMARWIGSFAELGIDGDALWKAAMSGYVCEQAISPGELALAGAIEKASWAIQLANWVAWAGDVCQEIPGGIESAQCRVAGLLRRSDGRLWGLGQLD